MSSKDLAIHVSIGALSTFIVSWLDIRPLGIVFLGALVIWLYSMMCPCAYTLENATPIKDMIRGNMETFAKLRKDKPAVFCLIVSVALLLLMILGHIVSRTWLVIGGLSVIGFVSSRHSIRLVKAPKAGSTGLNADSPARWSEAVITANHNQTTTDQSSSSSASEPNRDTASLNNIGTPSEVDEFLPEVNESAMQVLNLAGDDAILFSARATKGPDDTDDEDTVPMEMLMPDESLLPDVEKDRITDDNCSEDEFRLHPKGSAATQVKQQQQKKTTREQKSSRAVITTSDEEDEDEESLAKGLSFDDFSDVDASQQPMLVASYHSHKGGSSSISRGGATSSAVPKELTGLVTDFVSNMIPWNKVGNLIAGGGDNNLMSRSESAVQGHGRKGKRAQQKQPSIESSDDSEFELLNPDELKSAYET